MRRVRLDDAEGVEPAGDRRARVEAPQQGRCLRHRHPSDLALDEARDEVALRLEEGDHLRPDPERRRCTRRLVLDVAVDPEQLGVVAADPQHERLAAGPHLEVVVRDPAAERLDRLDAAGPDPLDDLRRSRPDALAGRVEERLGRDLARDPLAEDLHLDRLPGLARALRAGRRRRSSARPSSRSRRS